MRFSQRMQELRSLYQKGCKAPRGYVDWHEWAEAQGSYGLMQKHCHGCGKFYFPQEAAEHAACKL